MLKRLFLNIFALVLCFGLMSCEKETGSDDNNNSEPGNNGGNDDSELVAPVLEWWELYNPNGFDTFTGAISNPNNVSIDVAYDLVYFKDGKEVARNSGFYNSGILPGHKDIIWANSDIPKSIDADDVKIDNVEVSKAYYEPIDGSYEYAGADDRCAYFDFTFKKKPTLATIAFVLYNDVNGNKKMDKGEIVATSISSLMEKTGRVYFETTGYSWTDYEVYFKAY